MSIHPQYAEAILDRRKLVEFRKRPLAADVVSVLIYATSPVKRVVGEFSIAETVAATPEELWNKFGDVGCIDRASYFRYYANTATAVALVVGSARRLDDLPLSAFSPVPTVPQSFSYLASDRVSEVLPDLMEDETFLPDLMEDETSCGRDVAAGAVCAGA